MNINEKEKEVIAFWKENNTFKKSIEQHSQEAGFVFYDGPPFATGLPHYGHLVGSVMKDMVPRFWTMRGKRVERKWGWDCHGLPIENLVEKELGLNSKKDIEALGVEKFNTTCHSKVMMYADEWKKVVERLGRFVDMEQDYKTMDKDFMESVWWVFSELWKKGLIYEDRKPMHICPRCETTLAQAEVAEGYKTVKDLAVTAKFKLCDEPDTCLLAWTTTPWTLPGNVALAVGKDIPYIKVSFEGSNYIVAVPLLGEVFKDKEYEEIERLGADDLVGKKYIPLFPYFENDTSIDFIENAFQVIAADFVETETGTGVVHIAPGFGEDDFRASKKYKLPFVQHVGTDGRFTKVVSDWVGEEVKAKDDPTATDVLIIKYLAGKDLLFAKEKYEHTYPHCWRCDSPLLNYTTSAWFVRVTQIKDRAIELAGEINWTPSHVKEGRFGQWLAGARDWSISRQRYWGSVMPLWRCECGEIKVFGSVQELEKESGKKVEDLHKHIVDEILVPCECGKEMKRIPDVLDCWFESGSMPYAQMHYPFENKELFEQNFPAEFIAEGADQTNKWFYYMHVLSVALFDSAAYKNVIVNGIVLAEDGKKMSKRLRNYPDPMEIMEKYGSDAMRFYLMSSPVVRAENLNFEEKGVDEVYKKVVMIMENVMAFYQLHTPSSSPSESGRTSVLDRWILARLNQLIDDVTKAYERYDLQNATRPILDFVQDFSTWYVRRSRDRMKGEEKQAVLATMQKVMTELSKVMAPVMPFLAERLYKGEQSVHLTSWPEGGQIDQKVLDDMVVVRKIVEQGLATRAAAGIKVRQPLAQITIDNKDLDEEYFGLIRDELNVKSVAIGDVLELDTEITADLKKEGIAREITRQINSARKKAGLTIKDVIPIYIELPEDLKNVAQEFTDQIAKDTNGSELKLGRPDIIGYDVEIEKQKAWVGFGT